MNMTRRQPQWRTANSKIRGFCLSNRPWNIQHLVTLLLLFLCQMRPQCQALVLTSDSKEGEGNPVEPLQCRLTTQDTLYHDESTGRFYGQSEVVCDPVLPLHEATTKLHDLYVLSSSLPSWITTSIHENINNNQQAVSLSRDSSSILPNNGQAVYVNITHAKIDINKQQIMTSDLSTFTRIDPPDDHNQGRRGGRRLRKAYDDAFGVRTYAILVVSTTDARPSVTAQALRNRYTNRIVGMEAQYKACSVNQLTWQLQNVYSVNLPKRLAEYDNQAGTVRNAATEQFMKQNNLDSMEDLADNILYCIPPGTGSWVANAGKYIVQNNSYIATNNHMANPTTQILNQNPIFCRNELLEITIQRCVVH